MDLTSTSPRVVRDDRRYGNGLVRPYGILDVFITVIELGPPVYTDCDQQATAGAEIGPSSSQRIGHRTNISI